MNGRRSGAREKEFVVFFFFFYRFTNLSPDLIEKDDTRGQSEETDVKMRHVRFVRLLVVERRAAFGWRVRQHVYPPGAFNRRMRIMCSWVCAVYVIRVGVGGKAKRERSKREREAHTGGGERCNGFCCRW